MAVPPLERLRSVPDHRPREGRQFEAILCSRRSQGNQPTLCRRLELGSMGRKPSGAATSKSSGRNRRETRELTVFPARAWFCGTHWEVGVFALRPDTETMERVDSRPLAHREWLALRARYGLRRGRLAHPQEPGHRRPPAFLRLQPAQGRWTRQHQKRPLARRPRPQSRPRNTRTVKRTEQP
jgi:hypothetical protein